MAGHAIQRSPKINTIYPPMYNSCLKMGYPIPSVPHSIHGCAPLLPSTLPEVGGQKLLRKGPVAGGSPMVGGGLINKKSGFISAKTPAWQKTVLLTFDSISPTFTGNSFGFTNRND
jgi:hypothetical protein